MTQEFKNKAKIKAEQYVKTRVFKKGETFNMAHEKDYLSGYKQALKDSHAPEMLDMLKYIASKKTLHHEDLTNISELITKSTTL